LQIAQPLFITITKSTMYFLGQINNPRWMSEVGSTILLHFGPQAQAVLQEQWANLQPEGKADSVNLPQKALGDFYVVQVLRMPDAMATAEVAALAAKATAASNPVAVKDSMLRDVLLLTDEHDDVKPTRLTLSRSGAIRIRVALPSYFKSSSFEVVGQLDLQAVGPRHLLKQLLTPTPAA
jgi:hypothetical protein